MILRTTAHFRAVKLKNGRVRIEALDPNITPRYKTINPSVYEQMTQMRDSAFDGTCIMDLGIGVFAK